MRSMRPGRLASIFSLALMAAVSLLIDFARADTRFVSDTLMVGLRKGPGKGAEVITTLKTDTRVEVLEEKDGYLRVRTEQQEEGWIESQYVTSTTPKPAIIAALKKDVGQLESTVGKLEKELASLQREFDIAKDMHAARVKELEREVRNRGVEAARVAGELQEMTGKYATLVQQSNNVVKLVEERDGLIASNDALRASARGLQDDMEGVRRENSRLMGRTELWWFLSGSGVFLIGLMIGKFSKRKAYY